MGWRLVKDDTLLRGIAEGTTDNCWLWLMNH
jgi:hypothetical protein